jgi:hypothetical protein
MIIVFDFKVFRLDEASLRCGLATHLIIKALIIEDNL